MNSGQVSVCMSEPKLYEIWREQAKLIHKYLAPGKYLLSMDEIRAGGSCEACKNRNMTMAQILGDCITKQVQMIREVNPVAEIFIWSDMLDPNHNAHGDYYLVDGDFTGSWNYIPKDLVIVCWYYTKRNESLKFFSSLGFRTLAGAYYDGDTLDNPKGEYHCALNVLLFLLMCWINYIGNTMFPRRKFINCCVAADKDLIAILKWILWKREMFLKKTFISH